MDTTYDKKISDISQKYSLSTQQSQDLELNTTFVLLGQIYPDQYATELSADLGLPQDVILKIISDINAQILTSSIRNMIKQNFKDDDQKEAQAESIALSAPIVNLDTRFASLPENLQEAIANSNYQQKIYDIGAKYKLQIPQVASLEEITIQFIIGKISSSKYESDLALATDLEATKISEIAKEVNDTILVNIREYMKNGSISSPSINEDIEVPIPPYKTTPEEEKVPQAPNTPIESTTILQNNNASKSGRGIFADAGIEMMEESKTPTNTGFIGDKLFAPTKTTNTISNQTLQKITTPAEPSVPSPNNTTPKTKDPYHEEI